MMLEDIGQSDFHSVRHLGDDSTDFGSASEKLSAFDSEMDELEQPIWAGRLDISSYFKVLCLGYQVCRGATSCYGVDRLNRWIDLAWYTREAAWQEGIEPNIVARYRHRSQLIRRAIEMDNLLGNLQESIRSGRLNREILAKLKKVALTMVGQPDGFRSVQFSRLGEVMDQLESGGKLGAVGLDEDVVARLRELNKKGEASVR